MKPFAFLLVALGCAALGCTPPDAAVPPAEVTTTAAPERPPQPGRLPVAPMPHLPGEAGEKDLTNEDINLDPKIEAQLLEVEKPGKKVAVPAIDTSVVDIEPQPETNPNPGAPLVFGRTGATKSRLLKENGGNAESERAVALGLSWLAKQQKQDGSWAFDVGDKDETAAATGLALLPFLAAGETHLKATRYKDAVNRGVQWLVKDMSAKGANAGKFESARTSYGQAVATLALCEAYALTSDPTLKAPAQAAINYIQKTQTENGGWPADDKDAHTSLVGWQVQALKSAALSKAIVVDEKVIKKTAAFLDATAAGTRKATYGHKDGSGAKPGTGLTAAGLLCRYYISDWGPLHPGMVDGVGGLTKTPPVGTGAIRDLYYYHHATQVVYFYEGEEWKTWNEGAKQPDGTRKGGMRDWLVTQQSKKGVDTGSWEPETGWIGTHCGRLGTTATAVLTLEVYYRHLPLFKRGADGKAIKIIE